MICYEVLNLKDEKIGCVLAENYDDASEMAKLRFGNILLNLKRKYELTLIDKEHKMKVTKDMMEHLVDIYTIQEKLNNNNILPKRD